MKFLRLIIALLGQRNLARHDDPNSGSVWAG